MREREKKNKPEEGKISIILTLYTENLDIVSYLSAVLWFSLTASTL